MELLLLMLLLRCITFYSPYIQSLFDFSAFLIFPLQGRISLLFSLTFLPRAELRMRNGSAQDFSRHAAHEMKIVVIVVGSNITALWGATRQPHVGKFSSELSQSFVLAPQRSWSRRVLLAFRHFTCAAEAEDGNEEAAAAREESRLRERECTLATRLSPATCCQATNNASRFVFVLLLVKVSCGGVTTAARGE